ncbi:unnamed protein product [Caenorhabditis angaria]|uniref:Phosphodiesterase n=1 Tax=Caenorhabditis angaria TaxID=860376 RepID=A0A9P1IA72_9PELO|nr:unnamed protein product [Caenorhabditis angaria]
MSPIPTGGGGISPPVIIGSAPPPLHHLHYFGAASSGGGRLRDRSPRLSVGTIGSEMRRHRVDSFSGSTIPPTSPNMLHKGSPFNQGAGRGRGVMSDSHMQKTYHEAMRQRRTSLPANSLALGKLSQITGSSLSEAKGLIADMLMSRELPGNVATCLRAVATLLEQRPNHMNGLNDFGLPCVVENPYSGEQLHVGASKPRVSNITFSTVTSATGLPTIAAEPNKARSSRQVLSPTFHPSSLAWPRGAMDNASAYGAEDCSYWKPEQHDSTSTNQTSTSTSTSTITSAPPNHNHSHNHHTSEHLRKESVSRKESGSHVDTVVTTIDGQRYDTKELDGDQDLADVEDWGFPIFNFAKKYPKTCLSRLTYTVFRQADLFRIFKVSPIKFFNYFHALEKGYWEIPYHNRIHAADVLHGCFYMSVHPVKPQIGPPPSPDSLLPPPTTAAIPIMSSMSTLELMALYTAAAMHDYDHPGRTNAFLVAAEDKKAILYNDRSVLENHHAAESWRLLCHSENSFIENLDAAETKRFRYLVLEYILATDLKQHFEIIMTFNEKTNDMDLTNESDRLLLAKLMIKMADINSPTKPYNLHRQWTDRICEEFYEQGDEEMRRGMVITPYMDRNDAQVAKLQDSFIAHVVSPLAVAMNEAGLLPILPGLIEPEMMINLKHNHQKWLNEIEIINASTAANCNGALSNGVIEEESTASDSPDPRKDSPSLDSELD